MFWMSLLLSFKTTFLTLVVVVVLSTIIIIIFPLISFAYHGQEISILLDSAKFIPLSENGEENQVNVFVNYTVNDPSLVSQRINSVMKVYSTNGTLIKTSSFTEGFTINQTGSERHATLQDVIAVVQFTNLTKTVPLSNPLQTNLNLSEAQVTAETKTEIAALQL
jgi:hypothetical protein